MSEHDSHLRLRPPLSQKPKRDPTNRMSVTMMMPMSVTCLTCGNFIYRGTKFVMR